MKWLDPSQLARNETWARQDFTSGFPSDARGPKYRSVAGDDQDRRRGSHKRILHDAGPHPQLRATPARDTTILDRRSPFRNDLYGGGHETTESAVAGRTYDNCDRRSLTALGDIYISGNPVATDANASESPAFHLLVRPNASDPLTEKASRNIAR